MSTKIGHFEILSEIAKSPTGTVYKANDPQTSQTVALKAIQLSAFGERAGDLGKCLLEEAATTKALSHPNLSPVYGAGEVDGQFFAAMEYIQGNSIATMLARKEGFSIWDLLDIGRQVCSGLDHARSHNVFHFSLEPAKIMCGWDGTVRILGYGVSSVGKFTEQIQGVSPLLHYMSPEQVRGETIDARSNLFSLGAIFYEMVTDRKAFDGEDPQFLRRSIVEGTPVAPMLVNPKLNPILSDLIMKALAKDPAARSQSGRELLDDLEKCKESKSQAAKQAAAPAKNVFVPDAVKAATQAKFAAAPAIQKTSVEKKVALPGVAAKAAVAAAGSTSGHSSSSTTGKASGSTATLPSASMSSATLDEPAADVRQTPKITVDPLMAESAPARGGSVSFSEMTELPPLKEVYSAPPPPPPAFEQDTEALKAGVPHHKAEKAKGQSREVAAKAIKEVKNVPPRLIIYSVATASALILIVALALYLRIRGLNNDGDSSRPSAGSTSQVVPSPAAQPRSAQPEATLPEDTTPAPSPAPNGGDAGPWVPAATARGKNGKKKASAPAAAVVAPGQLTIDSTPSGAQVAIDGKTDPSWVTPLTLSGLAAGQHSVTLSKSGYSNETRAVSVASGGKSAIAGRLSQLAATLAVTSNPAGANIFVDGKNTGKLTPAQVSVDKGQHTVLVRKSGFIDDTTNAQFVLGQTVSFSPELRPLGNVDDIKTVGKMKKLFGGKEAQGMGTVSIKTQPKGAQVAVNQHMLEKESPVDFMLDPGNYIIDITMSGYAPIHKVITVDRGGKAVIDEAMQHE
jgi:serine/threonine protein kinase